ncbi:Reticulon-domain-containing protein [Sporodiniella umbellata]|nr:Reticulon-domain-containing protein [Sporodiniella umbellata]
MADHDVNFANAVDTPLPGTPSVEKTLPAPTETAKVEKTLPGSTETAKVDFEKDPSGYLRAKWNGLIYWESPKKSATFLVGVLGLLNLSHYYSFLQIVAGLFTLATGLNLVYVNLHKQSQRVISNKPSHEWVNPHSHRSSPKLPRERVLRGAQVTMDVAEVVTQHVTKLVLIEDNTRSIIAIAASFFVWTLAKYVSTQSLLTSFLVIAFSLPRLYHQHQDIVDAHVQRHSQRARVLAEQYGSLANQKAREIVGQVRGSIQKAQPVNEQKSQ